MKNSLVLTLLFACLLACCRSGSLGGSLSREERTWRKVCSRCHPIEDADPSFYPAWDWPRVVDKMQRKDGGNQFSEKQKKLILKYLTSKASSR